MTAASPDRASGAATAAPVIAIVGAGPAGVYAADLILARDPGARVDLFEKLPAPYGLVRYGVSPDHPRIKKIQDALHRVLEHPGIRLHCNVEIGADLTIDELRNAYDAVVLATGADRDAELGIPGADLPGSFGGADFVAWYDGHPDAAPEWPLDAESVAVIGAGNVALDVARMLITHAEHLAHTDIPDHVEAAFAQNPLRDLHLLIRRGPADVRFSPLELRELGTRHDVDVIVDPAEVGPDEHTERMIAQFTQRRLIVETLREWAAIDPADRTASRRVHLHFGQQPARLIGPDRVTALEAERTRADALGRYAGTGETVRHEVGAVYRTIGYRSSPVRGVPFDEALGRIPEADGRVLDPGGAPIPRLYATGWIRRGPVGLIGSTKSDAAETVASLFADLESGGSRPGRGAERAPAAERETLLSRLDARVDWAGWLRIDTAERTLGAIRERERTKIADRAELLRCAAAPDPVSDEAPSAPDPAAALENAR
ncbi:pyridine nucleotide-disulfide oxidoreductase [Leucobacter sp. OLJS4]|uniref:FAD-dependent oxidoreductase n=1 Tax=unclassified Leucobacter TaxID=2621730 RepID=UPI000C1A0503|nr:MULTISPECIES: FAD-dependent oxidoreductase [unclassified Leucobacter]PII84753.1 pyridine nucleotide-disulfide oxidoreductase [Leucobacter sp. OLCALW19]PII87825.1 pyridine nucleotide-disulfide oxidoreductase [Leucobacter sp. OLTLW20]PII92687.1 pyridine nucleotide-disulfide oxidoreductase [Leucobacter sp. OLAS13]PII98418.1 pyridine nucleotide-disulfide oxidoreductase [Leucobacter sp. OLDS2]PIJ01278.1 pyridine nucleotide-disulfide oxidoreductase [Leucobacter sp. OLCS4]